MEIAHGTLILLGPDPLEYRDLGRQIMEGQMAKTVAVLPTAQAFSGLELPVAATAQWLGDLADTVEGLMVGTRHDAQLDEMAMRLREASMVFVSDGSPIHLMSALKGTAVLRELEAVLERGDELVGVGSSATALGDPMIDSRGGAPTLGFGILRAFSLLLPEDDSPGLRARTLSLLGADHWSVALQSGAGLRCRADGGYDLLGNGEVTVFCGPDVVTDGVAALAPWWEQR